TLTISPVYDRHGHIIGASTTAIDITERQAWEAQLLQSEASLRENRDVLQLAMSTARMGAWSRDLVGGEMWWSPEFATLCGFDSNDATDARNRLFAHVRPEDQERLPRAIEEAVKDHRDYTVEYEFRHAKTGEWRWMESRGRAE